MSRELDRRRKYWQPSWNVPALDVSHQWCTHESVGAPNPSIWYVNVSTVLIQSSIHRLPNIVRFDISRRPFFLIRISVPTKRYPLCKLLRTRLFVTTRISASELSDRVFNCDIRIVVKIWTWRSELGDLLNACHTQDHGFPLKRGGRHVMI